MPIFIVVPPGRKKKKNHQIKAKGKVFNIKVVVLRMIKNDIKNNNNNDNNIDNITIILILITKFLKNLI